MADTQLPDTTIDAKDVLLRTEDTFHRLVSEHQRLDERIRQFSSLIHLTDQQQFEETALKKRKLALKDRIEAFKRQH